MNKPGRTLRLFAFALALAALAPAAAAQGFDEHPVTASATLSPPEAGPGELVTARLTVTVEPGWHIYGTEPGDDFVYATVPTLVLPEGFGVEGPLRAPPTKMHVDETLGGKEVPWYVGTVVFERDFRVPLTAGPPAEDLDLGRSEISWQVDHLACDDRMCLDPTVLDAPATLAVRPIGLAVTVEPETVAPGGTATVRTILRISDDWHIYGLDTGEPNETSIRIVAPEGFEPEGEFRAPDPVDGEVRGEFVVERDYRVPAGAEAGTARFAVTVSFTVCTDMSCLDPMTATAVAAVRIGGAPAAAGSTAGGSASPASGPGEDQGLLTFLWVAFLGGLGSILLPCVYPLIPLTVAFFSKGEEPSRGKEILRALLFCGGILLTFTIIGLLLGPLLQQLAASIWLNLFLFLLMVALAASLLGMFDIQLPSSWTGKLQAAGSGATVGAPIFMGVAFSFASFSCTVGVIGPLLAGGSGSLTHSAAGMLAYAVGFATPFFLLALFPMAVSSMPRGGSWMNTMKVLLGFFEVCFAGYYLWRLDIALGWGVGTWPIILSLWTVTTFVAGLYLLGKLRLPKDDPVEVVTVPRTLGAILFFAFAIYLFGGFVGQVRFPGWLQGLLPPRLEAVAVAGGEGGGSSPSLAVAPRPEFADEEFHASPYNGLWWTSDLTHGLEVGRETGRRILLNFTGITCTNCREVETGHMLDPKVREELSEMVLVELWTDINSKGAEERYWSLHHTTVERSAEYRKLRRETYKTVANPWYVILAPDGTKIAERGYPEGGIAQLAEFLRTGK